MSNTITKTFIKLMLAQYQHYEHVKSLSNHCLTLDQRNVLLKHSIGSFRELATIYLADRLEIKNGECHLEEMVYNHTEPDTNADIYTDIMVYASGYEEMLMLFNLTEEFYQQADHGEEWRILALYIQTQEDENGYECLTHRVNLGNKYSECGKDVFKNEVLLIAEKILVKTLEIELLKEEVK